MSRRPGSRSKAAATAPERRSFAERLLRHYDAHRRPLPWRKPGVPAWTTWVCEVMAQQTRIEVVERALGPFLERFPTPTDFASAGDDEVQKIWQGLGYYRRARLLRDGATEVRDRHGGRVPAEHDELRALPGVGDYTAAAIASIAFGRPHAAIDGNVERVLARHGGLREEIRKAKGRRRLRELAEALLDRERPGDFNQALMDLGSSICTPRSPRCELCPLQSDCVAHRDELVDQLPVLPERRASIAVRAQAVIVWDGSGVLAARIPVGEINQGLWELPGPGILVDHPESGEVLRASIFERHGLDLEIGPEQARIRHGITHHRISLQVHEATLRGPRPEGLRTIEPHDPSANWCTPSRKVFAKLGVTEREE